MSSHLHNLTVLVVDFDGKFAPYASTAPLLGPATVALAEEINSSRGPHLQFVVKPPQAFADNPLEVRRVIYHYKHWLAIIVNANATALLESAATRGNASYDPMGAVQLAYVQARQENVINNCECAAVGTLQS